jgi:hypothetical protein
MKPANAQAEVAAPARRRSLHADRPVFVAEHSWRERAVRAALGLLVALLLVWLLALVAGVLGFGNLPPLPASGNGDTGSAPSRSEPPPASTRAAPRASTEAPGSSAAAPPGGQPQTVPTQPAEHSSGAAPASAPANSGVDSHPAGKGSPVGSNGPGPATSDPSASKEVANPNSGAATGTGAAEAPAQSTVAHGPPAVAPSGNVVPSGGATGPSAKAEMIEKSPGGAQSGATETGRPG